MTTHRLFALVFAALLATLSFGAAAQLADKKSLTLEAAKKIAAAAEGEAQKNKWNVVIAVVDDGGHLIYLQRMDGTQTGSIDVAMRKAHTAMAFKRPTKVFEDAIAGGDDAQRKCVVSHRGASDVRSADERREGTVVDHRWEARRRVQAGPAAGRHDAAGRTHGQCPPAYGERFLTRARRTNH